MSNAEPGGFTEADSIDSSLNRIIECADPYKPNARQWHVGIITGIGIFTIAVVVSIVAVAGTTTSTIMLAKYLPWVLISVLTIGIIARSRLSERKRLALMGATEETIGEREIVDICTPKLWEMGMSFRPLARQLHSRGAPGTYIRICHIDSRFPVEPLTLPFEPIPLDQADAGFANLDEQPVAGTERPSPILNPSSELSSRINRNVSLAGGRLWVLVLGLAWLMHAVKALVNKQMTWSFIFWSVFFLVMLLGVGGRGAWTWRRQWLLIPGGVFSRNARFLERNWRPHLFRRSDSVLILRNTHRQSWSACIADDTNHSQAGMTQREAQMLLRAWLSPLPTPPLEQLSDLH